MSTEIPARSAGLPSAGFWSLDRVADALSPMLAGARPRGTMHLANIATDTRSIAKGDLFLALRGDRFDAHDFLADAVARGAAALIVSRPNAAATLGVPVFEVPDTLVALGALGRYRRRAWGQTVVAVAGSNGKTSTKDLLRAALGSRLEVHATTGNLNNQIGVPLTLLALPDAADIAVVETGTNYHGEVALLRAIVEPDIAVLTSIAEEHLEGLGDLAGVLREESAIFDGVTVAITPASQPEVAAAARGRARRVLTAGLDAGDIKADRWGVETDGSGWIELRGITVKVPLRGVHNLRNAMLSLATAVECGVPIEDAARGIASMPVPAMRSAWHELGRATLINDAYNSNPGSARAALELLERLDAKRQRVIILGTMRELGPGAPALHDEIAGRALQAPFDIVAGIGEFAAPLTSQALGDKRVITANDVEQLWPILAPRLEPDAIILLKASRGVKLERIVPMLEEWARDVQTSSR
jgi:UDP-N-acetylmuramoyl-tripeptide--D-alanyl-D-alanine ligase